MKTLVLDLDGTLCPHGGRVDETMAALVRDLKKFTGCTVVIATASSTFAVYDRAEKLMSHVDVIHSRLGCHVVSVSNGRFGGVIHSAMPRAFPDEFSWLEEFRRESSFEHNGGPSLYSDPPYYSFSVIGKKYTPRERRDYLEHDWATRERDRAVMRVNMLSNACRAFRGGQTGVDLVPRGYGKQTIFNYFSMADLTFIGDDGAPLGGDAPVRDAMYAAGCHRRCHIVKDVSETGAVLISELESSIADRKKRI